MITGLRVIWKSVSNKFHISLFLCLAGISFVMLFPVAAWYRVLLITLLSGGVLYFLFLAFLSLVPPVSKLLEAIQKFTLAKMALFIVASMVGFVIIELAKAAVFIPIYGGFTIWLILQAVLACALAYYLSNVISVRSHRALGWTFLVLAVVVDASLFFLIPRRPIFSSVPTFLLFYTIAWLAPCFALALVEYRNPQLFSAFSLIALVYTVFPVAFRLLTLIDDLTVKAGDPSQFAARVQIDEIITIVMFIWVLNALGNFFAQRYEKLKLGKERIASRLRHSPQNKPALTKEGIEQTDCPEHREEPANEKRSGLGAFLVFGLLFSALSYFVYQHTHVALGIPEYLEPDIGFIISVLTTIPFLFYLVFLKRRKRAKSGSILP
nr:hypothetical protein [Candidatus Njordarchaeota archaeon]